MNHETRAHRYAVVSGKGGVGKTVITANLAAALVAAGERTLVLDADLGLANLDVILNVNPVGTIQDVLSETLRVEDVLVRTKAGFDLLPAGSGTLDNTLLTPDMARGLESLLARLEPNYDAILFDAGAGIGEVVLFFARIADDILLVVTPELTSLMDAYATMKILVLRFGCHSFRLVVNQADPDHPEQSARMIANHLQQVVTKFLSVENGVPVQLQLAGALPADPAVSRAIGLQRLLRETAPAAPVTAGICRLAESLRALLPARSSAV